MKRYIYYILCLIGLSVFTGCMFEEEAVENVEEGLVHKVFTAVVEDDDMTTKTMLDEVEVDGVRGVLWEPEDVIGVAKYGQKYQKFVNTLDAPSANGVFEGSVGQDVMYYAVYPYAENQQMSTSVTVKIPTYQTYKHNSFDGSAAPMLAKANDGEALHFKNLCGVLAIRMTGKEKVKSIIFQTNSGEKASGEGVADPDYGDYPVLDMTETSETFIVLDCGEGVQLSGEPTSFHFVLPPATYNGFKLTIATVDGQFMEKSTDKQLNIKRSIVTKATSFAFESQADNFTNLSERGNANCYIVSQPGYYSFDGTVIGNGEFGFTPENNFHTNTHEISPVTSELLWADNHTLIKGCGYDASTGMVKFLTSGDEGNAVIAVKDSEGNILWSWHIWMTDQPEEQVYFNNAGTMMDRNLGATSATPGDVGALGLLYQWGRKDPFLGSSSISGSKQAKSTITWPSAVSSDTSTGTVDYVTSHPMTFVKGVSPSSYDWHYSSRDNTLWQSEKTIYDPCPSGWRVPDGGSSGVWNTAGFDDTSYDSSNEGINFSISSPSTIWYPASGYRYHDDGILRNVGEGGYYWSVTTDGYCACSLYFYYNGDVYPTYGNLRAHGFSVRCMKDEAYVDISYPQVKISSFEDITTSSAKLVALVKSEGVSSVTERGFIYGTQPDLSDGTKVQCGSGAGGFSYTLTGLSNTTTYYIRAYAVNSRGESRSAIKNFIPRCADDIIDLSVYGTANCYVVPKSHTYSIKALRGNSLESVGDVAYAEVLWETLGTQETPEIESLVRNVVYKNGTLIFDVPEPYRIGNAVIVVRDSEYKILWSWHIWLTDQPQEVIYSNGAGVMMDRNLGAVLSTSSGDTGECGFLYQWGRKDPFLWSSDVFNAVEVKSNYTWPSPVVSNSLYGTIEYAIEHPTTYIIGNGDNADWYYTGTSLTDDTRWQSEKTIYDPCPAGWRVPDGGENGIWGSAGISSLQYSDYKGAWIRSGAQYVAWYPVTSRRDPYDSGSLYAAGHYGYYWSVTPSTSSNSAYALRIGRYVDFDPKGTVERPTGIPIRCFKEGTGSKYGSYDSSFSVEGATNIALNGASNSYIVSKSGTYCFLVSL